MADDVGATAPIAEPAGSSNHSISEKDRIDEPHHHVAAVPHDLMSAVEAGTVVEADGPVFLRGWTTKLETMLGVEARGIERVPESERLRKITTGDYVQMMLIWFSANLTLNNLALGLLGPLVFYLGLADSMVIGTFGTIAGSIGTAYISTFGPLSGNRTLVSFH
jgi:hypothetical protein